MARLSSPKGNLAMRIREELGEVYADARFAAAFGVVQDQLGHSTITLTADTYTSVLPETARTAAEHTAALLFPARQPSSRRPAPRRAHRRLPAWAREDHRKRRHAA